MTLLLLFVFLVWLKLVAGTAIILFWLWLVRDRGWHGPIAAFNYVLALCFWAAPWVAFVARQSGLYAGHCGLRQGMRACGLAEYLWTSLGWARLGFMLDVCLLIGIVILVGSSHIASRSPPSASEADRRSAGMA